MHPRSVRGRFAVAIVSIAMLVALAPGPASAIVIEDQVQDVADSVFCVQPVAASACYNGAAQTVTVGRSGELTAVHLLLSRADFASADLVVEIHTGTPAGALLAVSDPVPAADIPVSSIGTPPEGALSNQDWVLFSFPTPATVTAGGVLAIVIPYDPMHATTDVGWGWAKAEDDVYAGGTAFGGASGPGWTAYADGSDFAFATYVAAGEPTCELSAWIGEDALTEPVEVAVGQQFDLWFEDFPPFGEMVVTYAMAGADPVAYDDAADAFGDSWWTWEVEASEVGDWVVTGEAVGTDCLAVLDVEVVEAAPTGHPTLPPTSTLAPGPTPTPIPAITPGATPTITLPPTSTASSEATGDLFQMWAVIVVLLGAGSVAVASARFSMRRR